MQISVISPQGQTTIPVSIRRELAAKAGSRLRWQVNVDSCGVKQVVVSSPSIQTIKSMKGMAKKLYKSYGGGSKYLKKERNSWGR